MSAQLLTVADLAARWHCSKQILEKWRTRGKGPRFVKIGTGRCGLVRYRLQDVEAYEEQNMRGSTSEAA